jgi:hypothetical protein
MHSEASPFALQNEDLPLAMSSRGNAYMAGREREVAFV